MKERNEIMRFFGLHPQNDVRRKFAFTLAEGATHVDNSNNKRRFAFTLAEVLVTLGIIGVVAVLTVPNVISSYQKKVYVARLQKAYNQLQQVFDLAMADDEVEYLADTELMQSINGDRIGASEDQSAFSSKLGEYMKIQKVCNPREYSEGCHTISYTDFNGDYDNPLSGRLQIFTKDGMIYYFSSFLPKYPRSLSKEECEESMADGGSVCSYYTNPSSAGLEVDVNGIKGPNRYGRDMFRFLLDNKGQVFLMGAVSFMGKRKSYLEPEANWASCNEGCAYGVGCAAKIMDNGWVMDY